MEMEDLKIQVEKIGNVDFEITSSCNLRCLHCYNLHHDIVNRLTFEEIKKIIRQVREIGFKEIHINGGEPLMHKDIIKILKYANEIGLNVLLETNALLLSFFINDIKKISGLSIRASIDGPEEVHNIIRRNDASFNSFKQAIGNLIEAKKVGIPVQITCNINKINYNKIYEMVKQLTEFGLNDIRLRLSMPINYAYFHWNILKLLKEDIQELFNQINIILKEFPNLHFNVDSIKRGIPSLEPKFFITPEGYVKPYPFIEFYIGNLKNETIENILLKFNNLKLPYESEKKIVNYLTELNLLKEGS